jgi:hypothetical protein
LEALPADTQGDVKAKLNAIIKYLRGGVLALVACFALPCFSLDKTTKIDDISGTNTIGDIGRAIGAVDQQTLDNAVGVKRDKSDLTVYSDKLSDFFGVGKWKVNVNHSIYGKIEGVTHTRHIDYGAVYWDDKDMLYSLTSHDGTNITFNSIVHIYTTFSKLKGAEEDVTWEFIPIYADSLATMSAITNAARDVVNSLYDEEMGVTWQTKMNGGNLYYIAVTNVNLEVTR